MISYKIGKVFQCRILPTGGGLFIAQMTVTDWQSGRWIQITPGECESLRDALREKNMTTVEEFFE